MKIRTRSLRNAKPGHYCVFRHGKLWKLKDWRILAPSQELLASHKSGSLSWDEYIRRYRAELAESEKKYPKKWRKLLRKAKVTFVCYENDPNNCHRSTLAQIIGEKAKANGRSVKFDIQ